MTEPSAIHIEHRLQGPAGAPVIVLIRGLGTQLIHWPPQMLSALWARGFRTLVFDNRDSGLSTKIDAVVDFDRIVEEARAGRRPNAPYTLFDMADDVAALMNRLGLDRVHIVGMSMGGRIAQIFAAVHAPRTLSLCSIMSTTGSPHVARPAPEVLDAALRPPRDDSREAAITHALETERLWAGSRYAYPDAELADLVRRAYDRSRCPEGAMRQAAAIVATGDQRALAERIAVPTLVIHGADDTLVPPDSGRETAERIAGARLVLVDGLGHALPASASAVIADLLADHAAAAASDSPAGRP